jgi:hypothetical protein
VDDEPSRVRGTLDDGSAQPAVANDNKMMDLITWLGVRATVATGNWNFIAILPCSSRRVVDPPIVL